MKCRLFLIFVVLGSQCFGQTIRFVWENPDAALGLVVGSHDLARLPTARPWQATLPTGDYRIHWRRSEIKQYERIFTGSGWVNSGANVWEGYAEESSGRFLMTTVGEQINSLRWSVSDRKFQILKREGGKYEFSELDQTDFVENLTCGFDQLDYVKLPQLNSSRSSAAECQMVEFGFVTDMAVGASVSHMHVVEAKILDWFAVVATYFYDFDVELNFRITSLVAPIDESPFPPQTDPFMKTFGNVNDQLKIWLEKKSLPTSSFDVTVGITDKSYQLNPPYAGHAFGDLHSVGTALMKLQTSGDKNISLMLHEIGHVFGASHDAEVGYIMNHHSWGGKWSQQSRRQISTFIQRADMAVFFQDCARLALTAQMENGAARINWETNYEYNIAYYVLVLADYGVLDTIPAVGKENEAVSYEYFHENPPESPLADRNIYRIYQYSIFGEQVASANIAVAMNDAESTAETKYGPNPFAETLNVYLTESASNITIYDVAGRIYFSSSMVPASFNIDAATWKSGLYFLRVDDAVYKIIKE